MEVYKDAASLEKGYLVIDVLYEIHDKQRIFIRGFSQKKTIHS